MAQHHFVSLSFLPPPLQMFTACNCYGHASECYYDPDVAMRHESLNIDGEYDGGGVCVNCQDNTMGLNCETCIDGYYRPLGIEPHDPTPCVGK